MPHLHECSVRQGFEAFRLTLGWPALLKDPSALLQVGPSFFDAPGAELAQLPGWGIQDLEDFAVTIVFCNCCYYKVGFPLP